MKLIKLTTKLAALSLILSFPISGAFADISFSTPATDTSIKSCDDYATAELGNVWDMSDTGDVNNFFPSLDVKDFSNATFSGGFFSGVTTSTGAAFQLFSPMACGAYPVGGRFGQNLTLDTTKYTRLTIRMYTDQLDPFGFRLIWNRSCNYTTDRAVTTPFPTKVGWHTYTVNLNTASLDPAGNTFPWSSGSITGFGILPTTISGASVIIDYIRLEDPNTCGSYSVSHTATADGNNNRYSVWLDDDVNPFNGYLQQLLTSTSAAGAGSVDISTLGVIPHEYNVIGLVDADYRTLEGTDPWDMNEATDIQTTTDISSGTIASSAYSGTTSSAQPTIYLKLTDGGINAATYNKLSFKITRSADTEMALFWTGGGGLVIPSGSSVGGDVYEIDLSGQASWTGTITSLILRPATASGVTFSLDFVALRSAGYVASLNATTLANSIRGANGNIFVNSPTTVEIVNPSNKGGEAFLPWNMNDGDFELFSNLEGDTDPAYSGETYSLYLPDVRTYDGLRGDFFKGTNLSGFDDPVNYSTYLSSPSNFDAGLYKNVCFKLNIATSFDLGLGSVGRMLWHIDGQATDSTSEDIVLVYDGWSGTQWYEYCVDMTKLWLDGTTSANWSGTISNFRVDAHEFTTQTSFYFDYIKLRKDATSKGVYNIVVNSSDPDSVSDVDLYYTSATTATGGTLIATIPEGQPSYAWNTAGVAAGSYLIYAVADDGLNSITRAAKGRITISNSGISGVAPSLSLETPTASQVVCDTLQVKGYAVQSDRYEDVSVIEVYVDGTILGTIHPSLYSNSAKAAFPAVDSSNAGFNSSFDFSSVAAGSHTLTIKAISADGTATTQTIAVTKQSTSCPAVISDPAPAGAPVIIPDVEKPDTVLPAINKVKHASDGKITVGVKQVSDTTCSISIYAGDTADTVTTLVATNPVTASMEKKKTASFQAAKIKINNKKVKTLFFKAIKTCTGFKDGTSTVKKMKVVTSKGAATASAAISAIQKKMKAVTSSKKKTTRG